MTLAERATAAIKMMQDRANMNELRQQAEVILTRNQVLEGFRTRLEMANSKRQALRDHKVPLTEIGRQTLPNLPTYQASKDFSQRAWERLKPGLEAAVKSVESQVQVGIRTATQDVPFDQITMELQGYRNDPLLLDRVDPLQRVLDRNLRKDPNQMTAEELHGLFSDLKRLRIGLNELRLNRPSDELSAFITKVRSPRGAALEDFTPALQKEARERNLMGNIRLRWV